MSSNWKAPIIALAIVAVLALGVLGAALVKLAGDSGSRSASVSASVTTAGTGSGAPTQTSVTVSTPSSSTATGFPGTATGELSKQPTVTPPAGAAPTTLVTKDLIVGTGAEAEAGDKVTVNYVGILFTGGAEFDSSWKRHRRFTFTLGTGQVIAGWDKGVAGMKVGGRRELIVPASLAYGSKGFATAVPIPPNAALVFVVDMLGIAKPPTKTAPATTTTPARTTTPAKSTSPNLGKELETLETEEREAKTPAAKAQLHQAVERLRHAGK